MDEVTKQEHVGKVDAAKSALLTVCTAVAMSEADQVALMRAVDALNNIRNRLHDVGSHS